MQRRKFLATVGSLAAGSAAAIGTGAVETFRGDRAYKVDVVGDQNAYVGLQGNTESPFVSQNGGTLELDFASDTNPVEGVSGKGVNIGSTEVRPAFSIVNQGEDTMYIQIENPLSNNDITSTASGRAASEGGITVPAGIDFQFIAVPSGDANNTPTHMGALGRSSPPTSGPDFGSTTGQASIRKHPGATGYNWIDEAGYVELEPGESVDVIARVVASQKADPPVVDFTVEAFSEESRARGELIDWTEGNS